MNKEKLIAFSGALFLLIASCLVVTVASIAVQYYNNFPADKKNETFDRNYNLTLCMLVTGVICITISLSMCSFFVYVWR